MKKLIVFMLVALISFFLFTMPIFAFSLKEGEDIRITVGADDDVYAVGRSVTVTADINGDLVVAGGNVEVNGDVSEDLIAAGGYLNLNGNIGDDVRVSGGVININGGIKDDLIVAGGQITLGDNTGVGGDLIVYGGTIKVNGEIAGGAVLNGGDISITGKIDGNVEIDGVANLVIASSAEIGGNVSYKSVNEAIISDGAIIKGEVEATILEKAEEIKIAKKAPAAFFTATYLGAKVVSFVSLFVLGIILILAIPSVFKKFNERMRTTLGRCVGAGAIMLFGVPIGVLVLFIVSVVLFITLIGAGMGIVALTLNSVLIILYALSIYLSTIFLSFFIGRMILYRTNLNTDKYGWKVLMYLIGLVIVIGLYSIPFVGWVFRFAGILFGFGGLMLVIKDWLIGLKRQK